MSLVYKKTAVMLVDDSRSRRVKLYDILKVTGFDIDSAASGPEAMKKIPKEKPALIIVNMFAENVGGMGFVKELRTYGMGKRLVVLALVDQDKDAQMLALAAGVDDLVPMDYTPYFLVELLGKHLGLAKIKITSEQVENRQETFWRLKKGYQEKVSTAQKGGESPGVMLLRPDGQDLGQAQLTDGAEME